MKLIQRYCFIKSTDTVAAGVYVASNTVNFVTNAFQIQINKLVAGMWCRDITTNQGIEGNGFFTSGITNLEYNPGFVNGTGTNNIQLPMQSGRFLELDVFYVASPSTTFAASWGCYFNSVTANQLRAEVVLCMGYLCPEDYLSVEGMVANLP